MKILNKLLLIMAFIMPLAISISYAQKSFPRASKYEQKQEQQDQQQTQKQEQYGSFSEGYEDANKTIKRRYFFPTYDSISAVKFWNQSSTATIQSTLLELSGDGRAAIFTDVISDIIEIGGVPLFWSLGFGAATATADSTSKSPSESTASEKANLQSLLTKGGNAVLQVAYPIWAWEKPTLSRAAFLLAPRMNFSFPVLGSSQPSTTYNLDLSAEAFLRCRGYFDNLDLVVSARFGYVTGSPEFYRQIRYETATGFLLGTWSAGLQFDRFRLYVQNAFVAPKEIRDRLPTLSVGIQIISGAVENK